MSAQTTPPVAAPLTTILLRTGRCIGGGRDLPAELREQLGQVQERFTALNDTITKENRALTDEERTELKDLREKRTELNERIRLAEEAQEAERQRRAAQGEPSDDPADPEGRGGGPRRVHVEDPPKFRTLGEQLSAVARASMPGGETDPRLLNVHDEARAQGASSAIPQDGGFLVQPEFNNTLLQRAVQEAMLWTRCRRFPVTQGDTLDLPYIDETSRADGSRWGGVQVFRNHEAESVTAKKPKFGEHRLQLEDLTGLAYATDNLIQDAPLLGTIFENAFTSEFNYKLDDEVVDGSGAGEMLGILKSPALVSVSKESQQSAKTVVFKNIIKMWEKMWPSSRRNAIWIVNTEVETQLMQMTLPVGTGGVPVYMPAGGLSTAPFGTLLGRPVMVVEQAKGVGTKGDIILADLSQYGIAEKGGLQGDVSMHVRFINHEQTFRWKMRNNGQPLWHSALTPANTANSITLSPFVALNARA